MKKAISGLLAVACMAAVCSFSGCKKEVDILTSYEITVEYVPENATLAGTAKVAFENGGDNEISTLKFQTYPNAYRKGALYKPVSAAMQSAAYYAGESYGEMVISSVSGAKNWEVLGEDNNILYVHLERSLFPGDEVVLDIGFLTKLANVNHRTGVTQKAVNLGNFFPILCGQKNGGFYECITSEQGDPFYSDCADYTVTVTLPKDYAVAATGEKVGAHTLESKTRYEFSATAVRDFAMVVSPHFQRVEKDIAGRKIAYCYYADATPQKTLETAVECFSYYEDTFGEYPYETYTIAQTGYCVGSAEYPCLTFLSDSLTDSEKARAIARETANQWWGVVVGSDQTENAWQDEGLAEYSALTFFENYGKYAVSREDVVSEALKEYRSFYDVYGSVLGRTDTHMSRRLSDYANEYEYRCLTYDKSLIMFDTLRKSVGDKQFFAALKKYYTSNLYTMVNAEHLIASFEKSGLDVRGFFESFLEGKAVL